METNISVSRTKLILMWGGIMGAVIYLLSLIGRVAHLDESPAWGFISFIISVAIVAVCMGQALKSYRAGLGGFITLGQGFLTAFLTGMVATVLMCLLTITVLTFMGEDLKKEMEDKKMEQIDKMEADGASEEAIEWTEKSFDFFANPVNIALMILVMYTIGSAIMALIMAAVYKKENPNPFGFA